MIKSSCHCGAVKLEIDGELPDFLNSCNCSACRRNGNLMAYYHPSKVKVIANPGATQNYIWGDKSMSLIRCATCGNNSNWESLDPNYTDRMGVNARLFDADITKIRIRHFDGADTWKYLD